MLAFILYFTLTLSEIEKPIFATKQIREYGLNTHRQLGESHQYPSTLYDIGCQWYSRDYNVPFSPMNTCWCQKSINEEPNCGKVVCDSNNNIRQLRWYHDISNNCLGNPSINTSNINGYYNCNNEGYNGNTCDWARISFLEQNDTNNDTCTHNDEHYGSQAYVLNTCLNYTAMNSYNIGYMMECGYDYDKDGKKQLIITESIYNNEDCTDLNETESYPEGCVYKDMYIKYRGCGGPNFKRIYYYNNTNIDISTTNMDNIISTELIINNTDIDNNNDKHIIINNDKKLCKLTMIAVVLIISICLICLMIYCYKIKQVKNNELKLTEMMKDTKTKTDNDKSGEGDDETIIIDDKIMKKLIKKYKIIKNKESVPDNEGDDDETIEINAI